MASAARYQDELREVEDELKSVDSQLSELRQRKRKLTERKDQVSVRTVTFGVLYSKTEFFESSMLVHVL